MKKKGFSIIEALAALVLITIIISFAFLILIQARKTTRMNQEFLVANQVNVMISNYVTAYMQVDTHFEQLESFLGTNEQRTLNLASCNIYFDSNYCNLLFGLNINQKIYDDSFIMIEVFKKTNGTIRITIDVVYYETKTTQIEVFIHE